MEAYFVDHTTGIYPQAASGVPFLHLPFSRPEILFVTW